MTVIEDQILCDPSHMRHVKQSKLGNKVELSGQVEGEMGIFNRYKWEYLIDTKFSFARWMLNKGEKGSGERELTCYDV